MKNKLIHAELNSQVQLSNNKLPSGSTNIFIKKNWEPLEKVYRFTDQKLQFKISCRLVPGGKFPFREQYCPVVQGLWLTGQHKAQGHFLAPGTNVQGTTFGHKVATKEENCQFRL